MGISTFPSVKTALSRFSHGSLLQRTNIAMKLEQLATWNMMMLGRPSPAFFHLKSSGTLEMENHLRAPDAA